MLNCHLKKDPIPISLGMTYAWECALPSLLLPWKRQSECARLQSWARTGQESTKGP